MVEIEKQARAGKFRVSMEVIDEAASGGGAFSALREIFSRCVIFRAEAMYYAGCIEYQAFSPEFDVLKEGNELPLYEWQVTVSENLENEETPKITVKVKKI